MKKIIIIIILLMSINVYAEIPGWLEVDLNYNKWTGIRSNTGWANTEIDFKYGFEFKVLKPYIRVGWLTYFDTGFKGYNAPFRDIYSFGAGIRIVDVIYLEYIHKCSHRVYTSGNDANTLYESLNGTAHNIFKIGLKFQID